MKIYNKLIQLKENLDKNWTYVHKILFTFTFYLTFKVFVRAIGFEEMKPYSLIFIILGFLVFTMDKLLQPVIDFIGLFYKNNDLNTSSKRRAIFTVILLLLMITGVIAYYISGYYPYVSISIFAGISAVYITGIYEDYTLHSIRKAIIIITILLTFIGLAGCIHSFIYNNVLNIFNFIYIVAFFIFEYRLGYWIKNFTI